jgi:hypothetical protein
VSFHHIVFAFQNDVCVAARARELMEQRVRDFWLELKKQGDYLRNPQHVPYILQPGEDTYYKAGVGPVGSQTCWPTPDEERRNNPNWPGHAGN